ncbi:hypothetical protein JTB14_010979 [Gonioctena quinquepunctata]|nr:hypothetical protein JTB14_010979 [Gonioctena quinquepunctata]
MKLRPICLGISISKVYEGLLRSRLENEIESTGGLSEHQYRFRKKRSTIRAFDKVVSIVESSREKWAALITLDVRNDFNSAYWDVIPQKLKTRGVANYLLEIVDSYLGERSLQIEKDICQDVTAVVPQDELCGMCYMTTC